MIEQQLINKNTINKLWNDADDRKGNNDDRCETDVDINTVIIMMMMMMVVNSIKRKKYT